MPRKKPLTAGELMRELEADPAWVARRDERQRELDKRNLQLRADESSLVAELQALGFDVDSVWDLVNNAPHPVLTRRFVGPYNQAYSLLCSHLSRPHAKLIREGIIRALTVKDGGEEVEQALLAQFEAECDAELRWVLANALRVAMPYHRRRRHPEIARVDKGYAGPQGAG